MKRFIFFIIFLPIILFADWKILQQGENDDCYLSWLEDDEGNAYVLKQIKDLDPSEQFLLVVDATANQIGYRLGISVNRVQVIPPGIDFPGKSLKDYPATLHTKVEGISAEDLLPWEGFTIHQKVRKPNSWMYKKWGPLNEAQKGLTQAVIKTISQHPDLQKIVALDTFVGNSDRSNPNIFYDHKNHQFYGIDMAASFGTHLALIAHNQLMSSHPKIALPMFLETLEKLYNQIPPECMNELMNQYTKEAGFHDHDHLNTQEVWERATFHKRMFRENYSHVPNLIEALKN